MTEVIIQVAVDNFIPINYATENSACMDLNAYFEAKDGENYILRHYNGCGDIIKYKEVPDHIMLMPHERVLISNGFRIQLPEGFEAQVRPRSGLALKQGLTVLNSPGTIDSDYRGQVGTILINESDKTVRIDNHERISQLKISEVPKINLSYSDKLSETERGEGGFGHTGVK